MNYLSAGHQLASRTKNIHLIGIGGSGMSGIAEVLHNLEFNVTGSDLGDNKVTTRLKSMGITVYHSHEARWAEHVDVVVYSSAIKADNVELQAAHEAKIPVLSRAEMLAELMRFKIGIAVAGTHGKTTTTSLVASILAEAGLDPTFVIGGLLNAAGSNAGLGASEYLVAEADESDGSFQLLQPVMAVVTNIDEDHMETFDNNIDVLKRSFDRFLHRVPFYGVTVMCIDDDNVRTLSEGMTRHCITYGLSDQAEVQAINIKQQAQTMQFDVLVAGDLFAESVVLHLPGLHNVQNALAAMAIGLELNVTAETMKQALARFDGVGRRFNLYPEMRNGEAIFTLIDDYAHHPTEIAAAVAACRVGWPEQRLVLVFQPHRYSRTRDLYDDFADVISQVDELIISEVYPAGEAVISGATAIDLCKTVRHRGKLDPVFVNQVTQLPDAMAGIVKQGDVVLMVGAGNIGAVIQQIVQNQGVDHAG